MTTTHHHDVLVETDEGSQELAPRKGSTAKEILREIGSVLRLTEADLAPVHAKRDNRDTWPMS